MASFRAAAVFLVGGMVFALMTPVVMAQGVSGDAGEYSVPDAPMNMTVSPISIVTETDPGKVVTSAVKLRNNGVEDEYVRPRLATFGGSSGGVALREFAAGEGYKDWVSFDETVVRLRPGEWKTVKVTFSPPESAALNYYYALLFPRAGKNEEVGATNLVGAPAVMMLTNVKSANAVRELQLRDFSVPKLVFEYLPVEFKVKVKNTGNVFAAPTGNIFIDGQGKRDLAILSFNPNGSQVLPDSEREYGAVWDEGFPRYEVKEEDGAEVKNEAGESVYELKWDFSKVNQFRFGKYTANLIMVYDDGQKDVPMESQVTFWVVPWKIMLGAGVVLVLVALGLRSTLMGIVVKVRR